ncbi:hypothetical protein RvY_03438 [Ramazzottius varieornatus]|uniref:Uncharacterized protein n=1 Tax=Ramazzottius varieornatus TaxID=947166 RepID=A0A1D1UNV6_RAMVA|nr:hypothetical protein RvY_03438 [Ramazzottius varieornatus]
MSQPESKVPCVECGELYTARGMSRHTGKSTCVTNQERKETECGCFKSINRVKFRSAVRVETSSRSPLAVEGFD